MTKKPTPKDNYYKIAFFTGLGLLLISISFPFLVNAFMNDWQKSGTFGDTYGALNALFSGVTVVGLVLTILMQRKELGFQREEMAQTRNEFSVNRITNIIYNQLERYEKAVENLNITRGGRLYNGYEAIFFLDSAKNKVIFGPFDETPEDQRKTAIRKANCEAMTIYSENDISIAQFAMAAFNAVKVIEETLYSSEISIEVMNNLKNIFFRNIGFIQLGILEDIEEKYRENNELSVEEGSNFMEECDIDTGKLGKANIFLKSINKFRSTEITQASLDEIKKDWDRHFGKVA